MERYLFMGGSGLLSMNWIFKVKHNYNIYIALHNRLVYVKDTQSLISDFSKISEIEKLLKIVNPDVVVNTIALTDVDLCEQKPLIAEKINKDIPIMIAKVCTKFSIKLVHISTDHLFDGYGKMTPEEIEPNPLNIYGKTKAGAEKEISQMCPNALIIRTNFFGWGLPYRRSFSDYIINTLKTGNKLYMFYDVYFTPIFISDLVDIIHQLIDKKEEGVFNVVCSDRISKYDFSKILCNIFKLNKKLIIKTSAKNYNSKVKRPLDLSLSNKKLKKTLGIKNFSLDRTIKNFLKEEPNKNLNHRFRLSQGKYFFG